MPEKCPACGSCGMPLERPEDFALGDTTQPYCRSCTDAKGRLLPYEKVLELNAHYYVQSQGVTPDAAVRMARALLADMPAWKGQTQERRG
ncbi:MAG: zinc ribbon domain-containing protein [SAR324 cluster bacterium]